MGDHPLLRFLDKINGPIVRLTTTEYGKGSGGYYFSLADLSRTIVGDFRADDVLRFCGAGWSDDRQASQEKAITEGIERWAYKHFLDHSPTTAGLDLDSTSNGFAALPASHGADAAFSHSFCEALERHLLNRMWKLKDLPLAILPNVEIPLQIQTLFGEIPGNLIQYYAEMEVPSNHPAHAFLPPETLHFVLSLFWRLESGVLPGSACSPSKCAAIQRSALEAYNHVLAIMDIESLRSVASSTVTDRRLVRFGSSPSVARTVRDVLDQCQQISASVIEFPTVQFKALLCGPWNPEVIVTRILVSDSPPIVEGDETRFLI